MPEVEALVRFLNERLPGQVIKQVDLTAFSALKTYGLPLTALGGMELDAVSRHGKFVDISAQGLHLIFHLARAGWLRWNDQLPDKPPRPGKGPLALRFRLSDDSGFDLTEAGTQRKLAVYLTDEPETVPGIAALGPDPLGADFTIETLEGLLTDAGRTQLKGVLTDQKVIAGIGNAYSDEILHAAKLSPFKPANGLDADERTGLFDAIQERLADAITRSYGVTAKDLKGEKKTGLRVHGRAGEPCPLCGDTIAQVSFADSSMQYCPACQTGGKKLADRRMSRLLK